MWETLPQIVVVGGQSSGKSSVLESIVGRDFLPRGAGICTRRPLVLQLHCEDNPDAGDTARFLHRPGEVFDDFEAVRAEIEAETNRTLGLGSKAVSSEPIMLSVRSPNVPNLTLVDMPGLTKVATSDQPVSIVRDIEEMAKAFIAPPNVVIVAVSPANADIATSDGVRVAREVDPNLERTIGVLTKLDLMDRGTDARDVLEGRALCLEHGWCAVVNRSQFDIDSQTDMATARENERRFFDEKRDAYAHVNTGTNTLVRMLVEILGQNVRRQVPKIQEAIESSARAMEDELARLGRALPSDRGALTHEVLLSCGAFEKDFAAALDSGMGGGESIRAIFEERLVGALRAIDLRAFYSPKNVKAVIDASDGYQPHLVAPEMGIRRLIELGLDALHDPVAQCVRAVDRVLQNMVERAVERSSRGGTLHPALASTAIGNQSSSSSPLRGSTARSSTGSRANRRPTRRSRLRPTVSTATFAERRFDASRRFAPPSRTPRSPRSIDTNARQNRWSPRWSRWKGRTSTPIFSADSARANSRTNRTVFATTTRPRVAANLRIFSTRTSLPSQPSTAPTRTCERSPPASTRTSMPSAREWPRRFRRRSFTARCFARVEVCSRDFTPRSGVSPTRTFAG